MPLTDFRFERSLQTAMKTQIRSPWRCWRTPDQQLDSNAGSGCGQHLGGEGNDSTRAGVRRQPDSSPTRSAQSTDRVNPQAPGWMKRLRLGSAPPDRTPCPSRMSAIEQSIQKYAEEPTKSVTDELTMILKQHYARAIMHLSQANNAMQSALSQAKNALQLDMFKFSDQMLTSISTRCVCCCARGFTDCPSSAAGSGKTVRFNTPAGQRIRGQRLDMSDCEATSPAAQSGSSRKRMSNNDDNTSATKKSTSAPTIVLNYFKSSVMSIGHMYADLPANPNVFLANVRATYLGGNTFFSMGLQLTHGYYIIHAYPRLVHVSGLAMNQQLVGTRNLGHELASIVIRRYSQSDQEANSECSYLNWRHNMEPGFATIVLADHDYITNISIQNQLVGKDIPYYITSSQMFFLPVPLEDGWIILMWDMMSRKLHVLDPLIRGDGPTELTKEKHEFIAWKLHHALFHCLNEYYAGWRTQGMKQVHVPFT